jgi:hypothetical protein
LQSSNGRAESALDGGDSDENYDRQKSSELPSLTVPTKNQIDIEIIT